MQIDDKRQLLAGMREKRERENRARDILIKLSANILRATRHSTSSKTIREKRNELNISVIGRNYLASLKMQSAGALRRDYASSRARLQAQSSSKCAIRALFRVRPRTVNPASLL